MTTHKTYVGKCGVQPQEKLIQIMMGRHSIDDLIVDADVSVDAAIIPILTSMFPASVSHVWWPHRF